MQRRAFLKSTALGIGSLAGLRLTAAQMEAEPSGATAVSNDPIPADGFELPHWLQYAQAVYFDGYGPPVSPHMKAFDAGKLLEIVTWLGGNCLRFQPIDTGHIIQAKSLLFILSWETGI